MSRAAAGRRPDRARDAGAGRAAARQRRRGDGHRLGPAGAAALRPPRPRLHLVDDAGPESLEVLSAIAWSGDREAAVAAALADARVTVEEAELVRAVSAALGLPIPPVVARPEVPAAG